MYIIYASIKKNEVNHQTTWQNHKAIHNMISLTLKKPICVHYVYDLEEDKLW